MTLEWTSSGRLWSARRTVREVELKLAADPGYVIPDLSADPAVGQIVELPSRNLRTTYYDTEDLRLARASITLRHRSGDEGPTWTLKFPVAVNALAIRDELHFEGASSEVPDEAKALVTAYVRSEGLTPVARLHTKRRRWSLLADDGTDLAELVDDEMSVLEGGEIVSRFREIEIEARSCDPSFLKRLSTGLQSSGTVAAEPIPKAVRALGARATAPPELPSPAKPGPDDPACLAVRAAFARGVQRVVSNDSGVRLGGVEAVHQMRVGTRRLRSDLRTFAPLVHAYWADLLVEELGWLSALLGEVRDLDVLEDSIRTIGSDLLEDLKPLLEELDECRRRARADLFDALCSARYIRLLDSLVEVAREPHLTEEATLPCARVLPGLVAETWKTFARKAMRLRAGSPPEDFHAARIKAKRVRYAVEAIGPALGERRHDAKDLARRLAEIQDALGEGQDALVACEKIRAIIRFHPADGRLNLLAGRLIERQLRKGEERMKAFPRLWGNVSRKKRRKWFET